MKNFFQRQSKTTESPNGKNHNQRPRPELISTDFCQVNQYSYKIASPEKSHCQQANIEPKIRNWVGNHTCNGRNKQELRNGSD